MDYQQFDRIARQLGAGSSRRAAATTVGRGALALLLGRLSLGAGGGIADVSAARKKRRRRNRNQELQRNAFGCVDVGKPCRGNGANCCSGICEGTKPKNGKKDTSRCVAHNAGVCQSTQDQCVDDLSANCGGGARCFRTTGNASFCGTLDDGVCATCAKDADCEAAFGPGAACVVCASCEIKAGTATACVPPGA